MTKVASCLVAGLAITFTMGLSSSGRCAEPGKLKALAPSDPLGQRIEEELAQWKPDHDDLSPILGKIFRPKAEIVGEWTTDVFLDGSRLSIQGKESGGYSVDFSTGGCLGHWDLQREGTYKDGVFRFKKAVEEYRPNTYDTLYAVSVNGTEYLISQSAIRFVVRNYSKKGVVDWSEHIKFSGFHRKDKEKSK
jgi:hypothetical protein